MCLQSAINVTMPQQKKTAEVVIPVEIVANVREAFARKRNEIVAHTKPWTPWALAHLLEIDDSKCEVPAEVILYKALRGKGRYGLGNRNPVVQVRFNISFVCVRACVSDTYSCAY